MGRSCLGILGNPGGFCLESLGAEPPQGSRGVARYGPACLFLPNGDIRVRYGGGGEEDDVAGRELNDKLGFMKHDLSTKFAFEVSTCRVKTDTRYEISPITVASTDGPRADVDCRGGEGGPGDGWFEHRVVCFEVLLDLLVRVVVVRKPRTKRACLMSIRTCKKIC